VTDPPVALSSAQPFSERPLNNHPHTGYVIIGRLDANRQNRSKRVITAHLVFVSKVQERMEITSPLVREVDSVGASQDTATQEIAEWSIKEVERQIK